VLFTSVLLTGESYGGLSVELQALVAALVVLMLITIVSVVVVVRIKKRRDREAGNT